MVDHNKFPACGKVECFAYQDGCCVLLTDNNFNKDCPFYKTREQVAKEKEYCLNRWQALEKENNYAE